MKKGIIKVIIVLSSYNCYRNKFVDIHIAAILMFIVILILSYEFLYRSKDFKTYAEPTWSVSAEESK